MTTRALNKRLDSLNIEPKADWTAFFDAMTDDELERLEAIAKKLPSAATPETLEQASVEQIDAECLALPEDEYAFLMELASRELAYA